MYLGIEIGGTKLQLGVGPGDGTLAAFRRLPVDVAAGGAGIRTQIVRAVPALLEDAREAASGLRGVGYGFGGPVDDTTRRTITSHQVAGWDDFPLAKWTEEQLGVPVALGNDADVAGLAEALFGAGKGMSPVFYVTVGSGIGGGLILDGKIARGIGRGAAEIGHLWVNHNLDDLANVDAEHGWQIAEHRASGWAIARAAGMSADAVAERAEAGDARALKIIESARRHLALALSHVIALVCPRRIVIGGGVSLMGEGLFFRPLREELARIVFKPFADCYEVVPAALGEEVVVHGALALARQVHQES